MFLHNQPADSLYHAYITVLKYYSTKNDIDNEREIRRIVKLRSINFDR